MIMHCLAYVTNDVITKIIPKALKKEFKYRCDELACPGWGSDQEPFTKLTDYSSSSLDLRRLLLRGEGKGGKAIKRTNLQQTK